MSNKFFDVVKKSIGDVYIEPKYIFKIPRFQRQYTWEEKHIEEFWETLLSSDPVFLGTIIFNTKNKNSEEKTIEIIDGQQRYLTIQILGSVIKNTLLEIGKEQKDTKCKTLANGIHQRILGRRDIDDEDTFYDYLIPGDSIKLFFKENIQNNNASPITELLKVKKNSEEERVKKAYLKFKTFVDKEIKEKNHEDKKEFLKDLIANKLSKHFFVQIEIDDEDLAYEIFETVNAKGVDLSVADLIKNQIFKNIIGADDKYIDSAKERWAELTESLSDADISLKEFLSYYWSSRYGYVADKNLYRSIRSKFKNDSKKWDDFLNELNKNAEYLKIIVNGSSEDIIAHFGNNNEGLKAYNSLRILRNIKAKTWMILYLCLFRNLNSKEGNQPNVPLVLSNRWEIIEKFTFLYFQILGLPGNWYFKLIWDFSKKIEEAVVNKKQKADYINLFSKSLFFEFAAKLPSLPNFNEGFDNIIYKDDIKSRIVIRYILSEIEKYIGGKDDEGYNESLTSIDHILPQDPKEWKLNKKEIKPYVNKLGNLTLIGRIINGNMGNKKLEEKILIAKNSKFNQVIELLGKIDKKEWDFEAISKDKNFEAIEMRQREFSIRGFEIWVNDLRKKIGL